MKRLLVLLALCGGGVAVAGKSPEGIELVYSLGDALGRPGDLVDLPLRIQSSGRLSMVGFTVQYDFESLEFVEVLLSPQVRVTLDPNRGAESLLRVFHGVSETGTEEDPQESTAKGWVQVSLVADFQGREEFSLPSGIITKAFSFRFRVREEAEHGIYPVSFVARDSATFGGHFSDGEEPVYNAARFAGERFSERDQFVDALEPRLKDGSVQVSIIGDVGVFLRGDANLDSSINLTDSIHVLDALFRGAGKNSLDCLAAADANADGEINLTDPIVVLRYLFTEQETWQPSRVSVTELGEQDLSCDRTLGSASS